MTALRLARLHRGAVTVPVLRSHRQARGGHQGSGKVVHAVWSSFSVRCGSRAWWRLAEAMLMWPSRRRRLMARLRSGAITRGAFPHSHRQDGASAGSVTPNVRERASRDYSVLDRCRPSAPTALRLVDLVRLRLVRPLIPHTPRELAWCVSPCQRVVAVTGARTSATWLRSVRQRLLIILEPAGSAGAC
jgi:hypothetical protein